MNNSSLNGDIWNAVLKDALREMAEEDQRTIDCIVEKQPVFEPSKRYIKNMKRMLARADLPAPKEFTSRLASRAVPALAALLVALLATLYVVADSKGQSLWQYIFSVQETYTQVELTSDMKEAYIIDQAKFNIYIPQDVPIGYSVSKIDTLDTFCSITFSQGEQTIEFTQDRIVTGTHFTIDTEEGKYHKVQINDATGFYIEKNGQAKLYFYNDKYNFSITSSDISKKQFIRMAESIKLINK